MAMVNVDLSEYDMLREATNKAEQQVKELKAEIEEYKKNARVIVTTKKCYRVLDCYKVAKEAIKYFVHSQIGSIGVINPYRMYDASLYDPTKTAEYEKEQYIKRLEMCIADAIRVCDIPDAYQPLGKSTFDRIDSSTEIKGFEDIRLKVEEALKNEYQVELEGKLAELKSSKEKYEKKYASALKDATKEVTDKYDFELQSLAKQVKDYKEYIKKLEDGAVAYQEVIKEQKEKINDLTKLSDKTENYKASARAFELECIQLKKDIETFQHNIKVLNSKIENKPWYKRIF